MQTPSRATLSPQGERAAVKLVKVRNVKHPSEEELILYHYAEAGESPRSGLAEHLSGCEVCRARYERLQAVLAAADVIESPEPGDDFEAEVWRRLVPHLESVGPETFWQRLTGGFRASRILAPAGAVALVAALVVGAFFAGRFWAGPASECAAGSASASFGAVARPNSAGGRGRPSGAFADGAGGVGQYPPATDGGHLG